MLSKLITVVMLLTACNSYPAKAVEVDAENALVIEGVIQGKSLIPVAAELEKRSRAGEKSVDLIINSPGGSVVSGFLFINFMEDARARGMYIRCFVPQLAASMAFGILVHCDERHSLAKAFLLWHRARVMGDKPLTAPDLLTLGRELVDLDQVILEETTAALGIDPEVVAYHFERETLHVGTNLHRMAPGFITSHAEIPGLTEAINNPKLVRSASGFSFRFNVGEFIYISTRAFSSTMEE